MNRLAYMGLFAVLAGALIAGAASAELYWDSTQDPEEAFVDTRQEPQASPPARSPSVSQTVKMYDDNQVLQIDEGDEERIQAPQRPEVVPPPASVAPPERRVVPPAAREPRTIMPRSERKEVEQPKPQPVTGTPGPATPSATGPAVAPAQEAEAEPPVTKRMPWGRVDVKQDTKPGLQWGKPNEGR